MIALELMRANPLASLISNDDDDLPFVSHLPLHAELRGDGLLLLGHCAKPNPHWRYLRTRPRAVVTFLGPHAYLSPQVYPDLVRVPTWNYLAVHCTVQATLIADASAKDCLLKKLIADHDPAYLQQWLSLDTDYQQRMLAGIVGFELQVSTLQCKLKLNQHRPEAHAKVKKEYADLLRRADAIFIDELRSFVDAETGKNWYDLTSQAYAVFLPVKSVGLMGDGRTMTTWWPCAPCRPAIS